MPTSRASARKAAAVHDPAYCLLCLAAAPHDGMISLSTSPSPEPVHLTLVGAEVGTESYTEAGADRAAPPVDLVASAPVPSTRKSNVRTLLARLDQELRSLLDELDRCFDLMGWAEDEIEAAMQRHGERPAFRDGRQVAPRGPIWSSFRLLKPTGRLGDKAEFVYRAHCREILERVAAGADTRPATDAEMIVALGQASLVAPFKSSAFGLYVRLFERAFPTEAALLAEADVTAEDYEKIFGSEIDDHETWLRGKMVYPWRDLAIDAETAWEMADQMASRATYPKAA